ncbi:hypothetical protein HNQ91_002272 [Filimonas zeae]|nr:RagB/SusD family nutrient uptake outer membrane protein [Filimonas zeae]MDR6339221.1 hypothetical protein [Filimonas zeae]
MKTICTTLLLFAVAASCRKSFLEITPKGNLIATKTADYDLLMNSVNMYDYTFGFPGLVMGDDVAAEETEFQYSLATTKSMFQWLADVYKPTDNPRELASLMANIYACNKTASEVMSSSEGTETQKRALRAEALANRAWLNFQLINLYAKPYVQATAATDPGFPVITTADVTRNDFSRGTVQEMYDFIISDLNAAIPDLPVQNAIQTRMSRAAAEGLLGKVYVYMGMPAEALKHLDNCFLAISSWATAPSLYDYNVTLAAGGSFLPITFFGPKYPGNTPSDMKECVLARTATGGSSTGTGTSSDGLVLSHETQALFKSTDLRLQLYSNKFSSGAVISGGRIRKYALKYVFIGVQMAELYLLRAEVKARLNDLPGAVSDVEFLRSKRMPASDSKIESATAGDQFALIRFIFEERQREFAQEGYRWDDMRRMSVDPVFPSVTHQHTLFRTTGTQDIYTLKPERLVMKLPPVLLQSNPAFQDNP